MSRTLLILAGALVVAGIAVFYVYTDTYVREQTGGARVLVVTAARDIPFGQPMQATWLTTEELPSSYVEDRHLRASEIRRLIGVPLAQSVRSGEAILRTDLSTLSDQQRTLSTTVPEGMRAVSLDVRPSSSFVGLLRPGDRVDVLLVVGDPRRPGSGQSVVVSQNLLVLSVGRALEWNANEPGDQRLAHTSQVSLECGLADAQRLALARRQGEMRLLLRNPNDVSSIRAPPVVSEAALLDRGHRAAWLRRFALVEAPGEGAPASTATP